VVQLTATANTGYGFKNWSGSATGSTNPVSVTIDGNKTVTANFVNCYTLTAAANPAAGGTVNANPAPSCNGGTGYPADTVVQLTATANAGYSFNSWSGSATGTTNPVSVTMDGNKTVTANFVNCYTLTTAANPAAGGTVNASPAPSCNGGTGYPANTVVQLTATANAGYSFNNWSGSATGMTNPVSVTMTENKSVTANFAKHYYIPMILR